MHSRSLRPERSVLLLHYALRNLDAHRRSTSRVGNAGLLTLGNKSRGGILKIGGPEGILTLTALADNEALWLLSYGSKNLFCSSMAKYGGKRW